MIRGKKVVKGSLLPSVLEDEGVETESEKLVGTGSRPSSRPRESSRSIVGDGLEVNQMTPQCLSPGEEASDVDGGDTEEEEGDSKKGPDRGEAGGGASITADEEYDTDLELEDTRRPYDPTGQALYKEVCKQLKVTPVSHFLRNVQRSELSLEHRGLGPQGTKALTVPLVTNTSILKLNLRDNWMEALGGAAVAEMLKENCYITDIDLSENRLGEQGVKALCVMLLENTTLLSLRLSGNQLDDKAAPHLAQALAANQKLQKLDLSHNRIGDVAGEILGNAIAENTGMKSLNLAWNCIRGKGAIALVKGIAANIFLQVMDLSYNGLGKEGAIALGEALKENNTLEELNISNNRIPPEGAIHFAMGLRVNKTIRILKMCRNPMQFTGCYAVLKSIQGNPESALEFLDFSDITVNQDFDDVYDIVKDMFPNLQVKHGGRIGKFHKPQS